MYVYWKLKNALLELVTFVLFAQGGRSTHSIGICRMRMYQQL